VEISTVLISFQIMRFFTDPAPKLAKLPSMSGKLVLLTGCAGIGFEAVKMLARKGADIIIAARDEKKGTKVLPFLGRLSSMHDSFQALELSKI